VFNSLFVPSIVLFVVVVDFRCSFVLFCCCGIVALLLLLNSYCVGALLLFVVVVDCSLRVVALWC